MASTLTDTFRLGDHTFRKFDAMDARLGTASIVDFPRTGDIPKEFMLVENKFVQRASAIFFHGAPVRFFSQVRGENIDGDALMYTFFALARSFAPKHEYKIATLAWLLSEYTQEAAL